MWQRHIIPLIPTEAGMHSDNYRRATCSWIPASVGMH
jgi:hypothetical protein